MCTRADYLLVIDVLDEDAGLAEVEDSQGRTFELPAEWLPGAADGAAYRAEVIGATVTFVAAPDGARQLRERSKQTLLDFTDEPSGTGPGTAKSAEAEAAEFDDAGASVAAGQRR